MKRVTGIGGIFFKAQDPDRLREWYRVHLGMDIQDWGGLSFSWNQPDNPAPGGQTVWCIFPAASDYFSPGTTPFMINYRVADLEALLQVLREEGCAVDDHTEVSEFGKFGWVLDPEGNKIELWQPPEGQ